MPELTPEQEEEVASGLLPFTVDGKPRMVPELKWRANREWQGKLEAKFLELAAVRADTPGGLRIMGDTQRELILAYDVTGALGDLEDATERDLDRIYDRLLAVAYPKAESQTALMMTVIRTAIESVRASSTNGPSLTGASAPTNLKDHLPSAKSPSSTRKRRSA